ncbi:hypothetical protein NC652_025750 [Populus alba x Populus x berolinensis]|nr:hypothetical protein NC652_025750 [Populus alba x Populus x berolinensis]
MNCWIYEAVIIAYGGWWSIDEGSRKEWAKIYCAGGSGRLNSNSYSHGSFPLPVFQGFKMCIGMSKDMLVQPIDFWYQCSVLCYGNECFHLWRNRIGRSHSIIWCYGAMILESHHYTRKYSDLLRIAKMLITY